MVRRSFTSRFRCALVLGAALQLSACSGKVERENSAAGDRCSTDADCSAGACVNGSCAENAGTDAGDSGGATGTGSGGSPGTLTDGGEPASGGSTGTGGAATDAAIIVDSSLPMPAVCFDLPGPSCDTLAVPAPTATTVGWTVSKTEVAHGGNGFALWVSHAGGTSNDAARVRAVYMDRDGGCVRPMSGEKSNAGEEWGLSRAAVGGDTLAAVVRCYYKFRCGAELHANGSMLLDLEAQLPMRDLYGDWTHEIAVATDGAIFVATGPGPDSAIGATLGGDSLTERWVPTDGSPYVAMTRTDSTARLVAVDVVDAAPFQGAALVLREPSDGGFAQSWVELQIRDMTLAAQWYAPPEVVLTGVSAKNGVIAVRGTMGSAPWLGLLDAQSLTLLWSTVADASRGLPFGVVPISAARVVAGTYSGVTELATLFSHDGTASASVGSYAAILAASSTVSPDLDAAPDGTLLVTANDRVAACPVTP